MRKISLLFALLLITLPGVLRAQSNNPVGGHFGLKAGASLARLSVAGISPNIPKQALQPNVGVMYRYRLQKFVIQPEALVALKGGTFKIEQVSGNQVIRNQYYYLNVPLLLGYIPTEGITLQAGPEFGYALNAGREKGPGAKNDLGLVVGAHYDFLDFADKFSLHVRYVHGFTNVSPEPLATYKNRALQLGIVYNLYPKPKKK